MPAPAHDDPASAEAAREAQRVARLARLCLSDEEARVLGADLARMLAHFRSLSEIGAGQQESATVRCGASSAPLRADEPAPSWPASLPLSRAPRAQREGEEGGFYRVPRTVGGAEEAG